MSVTEVTRRLGRRPVWGFPLVVVLVAAAVGIELDHVWRPAAGFWVGLCLAALACWAAWHRGQRSGPAAIALSLACAALAGLWHHDRWHLYAVDELSRYAAARPTPVCLEVVATDAVRRRPAEVDGVGSTTPRGPTTMVAVRAERLRCGARWCSVSGAAQLVVQGSLERIAWGDRLRVVGWLERPRHGTNPGEFDMASLARARRCLSTVVCRDVACVRRLRPGSPWCPRRWPGAIRLWAERVLDREVGPAGAPLAAALLLGSRERLDDRTLETFFVSGAMHVLAVSGLHLGILASVFWLLLRWLGWPHVGVLWAVAAFTLGYALVTGLRPPVLRAAVLVVVFCLARGSGRQRTSWNVLAAAGLLVLAVSPAALREAGAQLSFLAVATMLRGWPLLMGGESPGPMARLLLANRPWAVRAVASGIRASGRLLTLSAAIWLVTLPLVAARFHLVAPAAVGLNLLLWGPVVVAMFAGLLTLVASVLVPPLAPLAGKLCGIALAAIHGLTSAAAGWDGGHWWVAGPTDWWLLVLYIGLACGTLRRLPLAGRWRFGLLAGWLAVAIGTGDVCHRGWRAWQPGPLRVTFLAVGHGTSVLVQAPDGTAILYDAGRMGSANSAAKPICAALWALGVTHLDAVVLSHADADHFNAVPTLVRRFAVGVVLAADPMLRDDAPAVSGLWHALREAHVPSAAIREGDHLRAGAGLEIDVWHPPAAGCRGEDNANSAVLMVTYRGRRIMLPGDLEAAGLEELLAEQPCCCTVLMAPHHGSLNSAPAALLEWAAPDWVIISDTAGPQAEQVRAVFGADGATVLHTGVTGAVQVVIDQAELRVGTWNGTARRWDQVPHRGLPAATRLSSPGDQSK